MSGEAGVYDYERQLGIMMSTSKEGLKRQLLESHYVQPYAKLIRAHPRGLGVPSKLFLILRKSTPISINTPIVNIICTR